MDTPDTWAPDTDPRNYQACRTLGHRYDDTPLPVTPIILQALRVPLPSSTVLVIWRCTRCTMVRHDVVSLIDFQVVRRRYFPPKGYRHPGHRTPRTEWRESYLRALHVITTGSVSRARRSRSRSAVE